MTNSGNDRTPAAELRRKIEADFTGLRIAELRINPVRGDFDAAHLKEINRRIFQDLPALGFTEVTPGEFRPSVRTGDDWIKSRTLETNTVISFVAYSPMDEAARMRLDTVLRDADPSRLSRLGTAEFTQAIGRLYAEADYIHPFRDGNSRTLREFTRELADASGYVIEWERFNRTPAGRDILYVARDLSVNQLALPHVRHFGTERDVTLSMDQLTGNRDLPDLLRDAIRPCRAIAFERMPEDEALAKHPDLAEAYRSLHTAAQYFEQRMPGDAAARRAALSTVRAHVQEKLNQGETRDFRRPPSDRQKSQEKKDLARPGPELER
jgi:cell filamentation protein